MEDCTKDDLVSKCKRAEEALGASEGETASTL